MLQVNTNKRVPCRSCGAHGQSGKWLSSMTLTIMVNTQFLICRNMLIAFFNVWNIFYCTEILSVMCLAAHTTWDSRLLLCVCESVCLCVHVPVEARGQPYFLFFGVYLPVFWNRVLQWPRVLQVDQAGWPVSPRDQTVSACNLTTGIKACATMSPCLFYFTWITDVRLRSPSLEGKHFTLWAISPAPQFCPLVFNGETFMSIPC